MERIIDKSCYRTHVFEPVTEIPFGYSVWAIGRQNFQYERCIPLAKEGDEKYHIDPKSLKYIMVDTEDLALAILEEAIRHGVDRDKFLKMVRNNAKEG